MWPAVAVLAVTAIVFASRLLPWLAARVVSLYLGVGKVRWHCKYLKFRSAELLKTDMSVRCGWAGCGWEGGASSTTAACCCPASLSVWTTCVSPPASSAARQPTSSHSSRPG